LNMRAEPTSSKGLEIPCQNTFKDRPAFIKRLIKVLVAKNLFLVHRSRCRNNRLMNASEKVITHTDHKDRRARTKLINQ